MFEYIIILGREAELSVAELAAVSQRENWALDWLEITPIYARVRGSLPRELLTQVAGVVKLAEVIGEVAIKEQPMLELVLKKLEQGGQEQWHFGFSWYGAKSPNWLRAVGMKIKNIGRQAGKRARFVVGRESALSSVIVAKNKLLPPKGCEFIFIPNTLNTVTVARTLAVQEFEAWGERDFGRPARDAKSGMLPPKLARMMVNISGAKTGATLLDPFCGSGTVLQEAALAGYKKLIGSDISTRSVKDSQENFAWLQKKYPHLSNLNPQFLVADIKQLVGKLNNDKFDTIVTEPWLGPPLTGRELTSQRRQIQSELTDFYRITIKVLAGLLTRDGRLVMVWPFLHDGVYRLDLPLVDAVRQAGLKVVNVLPPQAPKEWYNSRGTLVYEREGQRVGREIVVLTK